MDKKIPASYKLGMFIFITIFIGSLFNLIRSHFSPAGIAITLLAGFVFLRFAKPPEFVDNKISLSQIPLGIKVIGIYEKWFGGVVSLLFGIMAIINTFSPQFIERVRQGAYTIAHYRFHLGLGIIFSIIGFILGNGLLSLKHWGRKGIIYFKVLLIVLMITYAVIYARSYEKRTIITQLLVLFTHVVMIYYLTRAKVKEACVNKGLSGIYWF